MNKDDREIYEEVRNIFIPRDWRRKSNEKITYTGQAWISNLLSMVKRLDAENNKLKAELDKGGIMNDQEVREKLNRLKEGRLRGDDRWTAYGWLMDELECQLDRKMSKKDFDSYQEARLFEGAVSPLMKKYPPNHKEYAMNWLAFCRTLVTGLKLIEATALKSLKEE